MTPSTRTERRRSDTDIFAEARKARDERPAIPATLRVHVDDGVAWLTGVARKAFERQHPSTRVARSVWLRRKGVHTEMDPENAQQQRGRDAGRTEGFVA
jgi:hypothetical protein